MMTRISEELADDFAQDAETDYSMMDDWVRNSITLRIKQRVFGKQVLHEVISYPANWKEAFKEQWCPEWAKRRWPVRYTTKTFDVRELVPSLDIPLHRTLINVDVT